MYGDPGGLHTHLIDKTVGPWPCSECGRVTQYAEITHDINRIYCKNDSCRFIRIIDKKNSTIVENDGTFWRFDEAGNKTRIRAI